MSNNLWILKPNPTRPNKKDSSKDPWTPWYDKNFGMIICASSAKAARIKADMQHGDETIKELNPYLKDRDGHWLRHPWLNPKLSTCRKLIPKKKEYVVMTNFASA